MTLFLVDRGKYGLFGCSQPADDGPSRFTIKPNWVRTIAAFAQMLFWATLETAFSLIMKRCQQIRLAHIGAPAQLAWHSVRWK